MGILLGKMVVHELNDGLSGEAIRMEFRRYVPWSVEKSQLFAVCSVEIVDEEVGMGGIEEQVHCSSQEYINMINETHQPVKGSSVRAEAECSNGLVFKRHDEKGKLAVVYGRVAMIGHITFTLGDVKAEEMHEVIQLIKEKLFNFFRVDFIITNEYVYTYYSEGMSENMGEEPEEMGLGEAIQSLSRAFDGLPETEEEFINWVAKQDGEARLNRKHLLMMGFKGSGRHTLIMKRHKVRKAWIDDSIVVLEG